ncbi:MAG: HAMP domain-containing histidine kinase [Hydrogenothermaceae bacterium]|nr:HAMP domain-containing histidine kinase [Hydrogenothermaceae bacterium]
MSKELDEFHSLRLKIVLFIQFLIFLVLSIMSYSVYLSYKNQRIAEIQENNKTIYLDILQLIDSEGVNLKKLINYNLPNNTTVCIADRANTVCIKNEDNFISFSKQSTKLEEESYIIYSNNSRAYSIVVATSTKEMRKELKKLRFSILFSDILVLGLSGFLAYSVFGRLLEPIKRSRDKLNQILQIISHDIRTPISIIDTNLYLLKVKSGIKSKNLDNIEKNVKYIKALLKNIGYLNEKPSNKREEININNIIKEILERFNPLIQQKRLTVIVEEKDNPVLKGDYVDFDILFSNLIDNAIKYSYDGGRVEIEIDGKSISITNTGPQIADKDKVFKKYYREESSGTIPGIGVGLSIVKKICNNYNLKVDVYSENGLNRFTIRP